MGQQVQTCRERSREYLAKAFRELEAGDLTQASEKGWGAAAQIVKAVADVRGRPHSSHALLLRMADDLEQELGGELVGGMFDAAHRLHGNFYEGTLHGEEVEWRLRSVEQFVYRLERLLDDEEDNTFDAMQRNAPGT